MGKPIQNVLAQNSSGEIAYLCGKCGGEVEKEAVLCEHCGAKLGKIRCPFCNYVGSIDDFKIDTCPRCGRKSIQKNKEKKMRRMQNPVGLSTRLFWFLFVILISSIFFLIIILFNYFDLF